MPRATDADVNILMDTVGQVYTSFIATANLIVNEELVGQPASGPPTEARLTEIEKYLAAHYATLAKEHGGIVREVQGDAAQTYVAPSDKMAGLMTTRFGQQAVALDNSGILIGLTTGKLRAQFRVV